MGRARRTLGASQLSREEVARRKLPTAMDRREILPTHRLQTRPSMVRPRTPPGSSTVPGTLDTLDQRGRATMGSGATQAQATHHHPRRPFRKAGLEMRQDVFLKKKSF